MGSDNGRAGIPKRATGSSIAEFGPALFILLVIVFLPLIGMLNLLDGAATLYFATANAARAAGPANTFTEARQNMTNAAQTVIGGPLGAFASLSPQNSSGMQMTVLQVSAAGGDTSTFAAGQGSAGPQPDTASNFYQFQVTSAGYTIRPLFWPGKPVPMTFTSSCSVEHPEGLTQ